MLVIIELLSLGGLFWLGVSPLVPISVIVVASFLEHLQFLCVFLTILTVLPLEQRLDSFSSTIRDDDTCFQSHLLARVFGPCDGGPFLVTSALGDLNVLLFLQFNCSRRRLFS